MLNGDNELHCPGGCRRDDAPCGPLETLLENLGGCALPISPCPPPVPPCPPCPPPPAPEAAPLSWALYTQRGTLANTALGGALVFSDLQTSSVDDYALDLGILYLAQPGTYLLSYTVYVPDNTAASTTLTLQYGGTAPSVPVLSTAASPSRTYAAQDVFTTPGPATLRLSSSAIVSWSASDPNALMASVFVFKLA